jgi:putative heme-binding domain-containing protein
MKICAALPSAGLPLKALLGAALLLAAAPDRGAAQVADHQYTSAEIEIGSRLYVSQCALCHGANGDQVAGINLRRGQFRRPLSDAELRTIITTGAPDAGMPAFQLQPTELDGIVAFIRAGFDMSGAAVRIGDAATGRTLFEGIGGCLNCHRVDGIGSRLAPDLSDVGAIRQPAILQRSLLEPSSTMWPINRPVRIVTRDGEVITGRRLNEDTFSVQLIDGNEQLRSLMKAELQEYEVGTTSPMPPASDTLSSDEIAHLIAYLLTLRGSQ